MSMRAKAMATLYRRKKITLEGLRKAVTDNVITDEEYKKITGLNF